MNEVEKNMAVSALAQLLDQQPTAYAEVLAACRAMGWNASPTAQPQDIIDELPSNVLPFIRRMLALLIYGDGSQDSPAVVPVTERLYAQLVPRVTSPNYPAEGFPTVPSTFSPMTPSIRDFAHLPQALSALSARKITNGNATNDGIPDGMSLAHLLCSAAANDVTEIKDDNSGYNYTKQFPWSTFPNIKKATLNFVSTDITIISGHQNIEELVLPAAEVISRNQMSYTFISNCHKLKKIDGKAFKRFSSSNGTMMIRDCAALEEIDFRNSTNIGTYVNIALIYNCPSLRKIIIGTTGTNPYDSNTDNLFGSPNYQSSSTANLVHLELGEGFNYSLNTRQWNPTNALDASRTDLIEEGSTAQNNLDQFLQNFRSHIALRLTDNGSGLTLTLSQAVYDAIKDETHLFVFDEGTMTIYAYLTNIKHWTVTK